MEEHGLISKVEADTCYTPVEREALAYLLRSIKRSPESINYLIISVFSIVAIGNDVAMVLL